MRVGEALDFFQSRASHRSYPVVDEEGGLIGIVSSTDALRWQAGETSLTATLAEAMSDPALPFVYPNTTIGTIADLIIDSGSGRIPIVDPAYRRVVDSCHGRTS
ncbi:MAG: CBS domain-containing protein [Sphingopyxis terrae]|nr:CBS domain-containing protein [Sphingopyxis terrae]